LASDQEQEVAATLVNKLGALKTTVTCFGVCG